MAKIKKIQNELTNLNVDALLITSTYNRRYISNFTGTAGAVLITKTEAYFITDFRYVEQAQKQAAGFQIIKQQKTIDEEVARLCKENGVEKLGFEKNDVSFAHYKNLEKLVDAALVPISGVVEKLRMIKTPEELSIIKEACRIADAAFEHILGFITPGKKEIEVANELDFYMRKLGATSVSFDTIVASGTNSALPHGVASEKVIEKGDVITLDFGCYYKGYVSDITRTISLGDPGDELKKIHDIVLTAQLKGVQGICAGLTGKQADAIARDYITSKGYGDNFGHSTGHGIGLEVHEAPGLSHRTELLLEPGMVVTCEPGIYVPGVGGVRIEDDLLITETGNEILTHSKKELIIL